MKIHTLIFAFFAAISGITNAADAPHTPEPESVERQSICDGARSFVMKHYVSSSKLPQPILFKIKKISVSESYCSFEATPVFKDGSAVSTEYIMDIVFDLCLKKNNDKWEVIYDLSSTDVPDDKRLKQMWQDFPKDFPPALIPEFWSNHFKRIR